MLRSISLVTLNQWFSDAGEMFCVEYVGNEHYKLTTRRRYASIHRVTNLKTVLFGQFQAMSRRLRGCSHCSVRGRTRIATSFRNSLYERDKQVTELSEQVAPEAWPAQQNPRRQELSSGILLCGTCNHEHVSVPLPVATVGPTHNQLFLGQLLLSLAVPIEMVSAEMVNEQVKGPLPFISKVSW